MNDALKRMVPRWLIKLALPQVMRREARRHGLSMEIRSDHIDLVKGATVLRVSSDHAVYLTDAMVSFDYYATAVVPLTIDGRNIIDFSTPRYHDVVGFEAFPILFPSLAEPIVTATQYMGFADLSEGMTVLDLGAYSGLTSILFSQAVGRTGTVVAVEADARNIACIRRNFANYRKFLGGSVQLCEGAVWDADGELAFSSEGNMGSSAASIVGGNRGVVGAVRSFTLGSIARQFALTRVDFLKCDIEGAERVIFGDREFFARFAPRIIIEPHILGGVETTAACISALESHGYGCEKIVQHGVPLPLIQCAPARLSSRPAHR